MIFEYEYELVKLEIAKEHLKQEKIRTILMESELIKTTGRNITYDYNFGSVTPIAPDSICGTTSGSVVSVDDFGETHG